MSTVSIDTKDLQVAMAGWSSPDDWGIPHTLPSTVLGIVDALAQGIPARRIAAHANHAPVDRKCDETCAAIDKVMARR